MCLRRAKIEEWIDEPYFEKTIKNAFVKLSFGQKYLIAEIIDIKEDWQNSYKLTNGTKTGIYLKMQTTEKLNDKMKWYKIIQVSN